MNEAPETDDGSDSSEREPLVGECTACGQVYTLQPGADGDVVPLGTDRCQCGNDEFVPLTGE